jgi:hypothetical protein
VLSLPGRVSSGKVPLVSGTDWTGGGVDLIAGLDAVKKSVVAVLTVPRWTAFEGASLNGCRNEPKNITQL